MSRPILPESAYEALGLDSETIKILMTPKPPDEPEVAAPNILQSDEDNVQPLALNETSITLYAELLLHIRTITLFASLRTHYDRETMAKMSSDGTSITVTHEGYAASIRMPFAVKGGGDAEMTLPSEPPNKNITMRLQLEELEDSDVLGALQSEDRKVNVVPWDGASLDKQSDLEVWCKSCKGVVVPKDKISQWRDLPNENWAEMMDFWHCHKPDEHHLHDHTHEDATEAKGYAAGNKLQAMESVGFVDLTSFLLKEQDCEGAQRITQDSTQESFILCEQCNATLGSPDANSDGWRIWKWNIDIHCRTSPRTKLPFYSTQKWITARLLYLIENTGLRKFHIHPTPASVLASKADNADEESASMDPVSITMDTVPASMDLPIRSVDPTPATTDLTPTSTDPELATTDPTRITVDSVTANTDTVSDTTKPTPTNTDFTPSNTNSAPELDIQPITPSLLVWVFTPDLLFSSSLPSPGRLDPTRSMKVFYQPQTWHPLQPGEPESASIEDVEFPAELFAELSSVLEKSQKVLPPTARKFQGWEVGLLQRFDAGDLRVGDGGEEDGGEGEESDGNVADGEDEGKEE